MYETIKTIVRSFVPTRVLRKHESWLRKLVALRYSGNTYTCNVCDFGLRQFVQLDNGELLCPRCGSLPRTRRLWQLLETEVGISGKDILHFSPPKAFNQKIKQYPYHSYVTSDYLDEFEADKKLDITDIAEADNSYDLIICYHVLEHIEADQQAMRELYRILKPGGRILIQTPFKNGDIYEDYNMTTPEARLQHFGQEDHVRVYSVSGLRERLETAGFGVEVRTFEVGMENPFGFKDGEMVLMGKKECE